MFSPVEFVESCRMPWEKIPPETTSPSKILASGKWWNKNTYILPPISVTRTWYILGNCRDRFPFQVHLKLFEPDVHQAPSPTRSGRALPFLVGKFSHQNRDFPTVVRSNIYCRICSKMVLSTSFLEGHFPHEMRLHSVNSIFIPDSNPNSNPKPDPKRLGHWRTAKS